jgi:hypothetical protein
VIWPDSIEVLRLSVLIFGSTKNIAFARRISLSGEES